jgi:hypothetical protein
MIHPDSTVDDCLDEIGALEREIERLRAGMREYACTNTDQPCGCYQQFLSEKAEIERLRALLREALPFIDDAGDDEDPEAKRYAIETADSIRRVLGEKIFAGRTLFAGEKT